MIQILRGEKGFTLIELMIVIAIMGILAAIAIPNFIAYMDKTYCSKAEQDASNILSAISCYFSEPKNITLTGGIDTLKADPVCGLRVSEDNEATVTEDTSTTPSIFKVEVSDGSSKCPRSNSGKLKYTVDTGGLADQEWK